MIGKLHEQSREPCILPLQLDKIKFTKHHQVFYIYNPQNEMFWHFRTKCSFPKTKRTS